MGGFFLYLEKERGRLQVKEEGGLQRVSLSLLAKGNADEVQDTEIGLRWILIGGGERGGFRRPGHLLVLTMVTRPTNRKGGENTFSVEGIPSSVYYRKEGKEMDGKKEGGKKTLSHQISLFRGRQRINNQR